MPAITEDDEVEASARGDAAMSLKLYLLENAQFGRGHRRIDRGSAGASPRCSRLTIAAEPQGASGG